MILLAYLAVVAAVIWLLAYWPRLAILSVDHTGHLLVRVATGGVAAFLAVTSVGGLASLVADPVDSFSSDSDRIGYLIWATEAAGAAFYLVGTILWRGRLALRLRLLGWLGMVGAFGFPNWSVILTLPFLALLVVTLHHVPTTAASRGVGIEEALRRWPP